MTFNSSHPTILTTGGSYFNFLEPENSRIEIEDIAHALSHLCRFTGHCRKFYSVAQHSVHVSELLPPEYRLAGLLHDAAEAFIGDVSSPLKALLPDYKEIEKRIEAAVLARFGLAPELPLSVKCADLRMLATEQRDLLPPHGDEWAVLDGVPPCEWVVVPQAPRKARGWFLRKFAELT